MASYREFEEILEFTLIQEGGYSNHPDDHGGPTNYGITQATYQAWCKKNRRVEPRSVRLIEKEDARAIYYEEYWLPMRCNLMPFPLAAVCFDWAVHAGLKRPTKALQYHLSLIRDGIFGPATERALIKFLDTPDGSGMTKEGQMHYVATLLIADRTAHLRRIGKGTQAKFLKGWMNRIEALKKFIAPYKPVKMLRGLV